MKPTQVAILIFLFGLFSEFAIGIFMYYLDVISGNAALHHSKILNNRIHSKFDDIKHLSIRFLSMKCRTLNNSIVYIINIIHTQYIHKYIIHYQPVIRRAASSGVVRERFRPYELHKPGHSSTLFYFHSPGSHRYFSG